THVLKALSLGAKAVSGGRLYLYELAAAGQAGVERALGILEAEIVRDMKLMGVTRIDQINRENLRRREAPPPFSPGGSANSLGRSSAPTSARIASAVAPSSIIRIASRAGFVSPA